jgi:hypothetical protein
MSSKDHTLPHRPVSRAGALLVLGLATLAALASAPAVALPVAPAPHTARATLVADHPADVLPVEDQDKIFGVVDGELQVLINLQPYQDTLAALSPEDATALLTRSAEYYAKQILAEPDNAAVAKARVDLIGLSDLNEYGNADLGTIDKFGFIRLTKENDKIEVVENTVRYGGDAR